MKLGTSTLVVPGMKGIAAIKWTFGKELAVNGALGLVASTVLVVLRGVGL